MLIWKTMKKPIVGLAPMDGVTDAAMRYIQAKVAKPDLIYTEQISVESLVKAPDKIRRRLSYSAIEYPIVCQLSGYNPQYYRQAAECVLKLGFAAIDINLGCPIKVTDRHGQNRGAGLIGEKESVRSIVRSCRDAIDSSKRGSKVGLSVKTRVGREQPIVEQWIGFLCSLPIDAITLHGRTLKQGYTGQADWDQIAKGASIAQKSGKVFLGNGDITDRDDSIARCKKHRLDGVLIGRAALGNPWCFSLKTENKPDIRKRLKTMLEHAKYYQSIRGRQPFLNIRKHLAWYARDAPAIKELRSKLVFVNSFKEVETITKDYLKTL